MRYLLFQMFCVDTKLEILKAFGYHAGFAGYVHFISSFCCLTCGPIWNCTWDSVSVPDKLLKEYLLII